MTCQTISQDICLNFEKGYFLQYSFNKMQLVWKHYLHKLCFPQHSLWLTPSSEEQGIKKAHILDNPKADLQYMSIKSHYTVQ